MRTDFLNLYRCPKCRDELELVGESVVEDAGEVRTARLRCVACDARFDVRDGIVHLLPDEQELGEVKTQELKGWEEVTDAERDLERHHAFWEKLPHVEGLASEGDDGATHWMQASVSFPVVQALMGPLEGKTVLDVGASFGWAARRFAEKGARVVAADMSSHFLGLASYYLKDGVYFERLCADAEAMPLADGIFDFAFCCATLHHFEHPGRSLGEIARLLRPGGRFFAINEAYRPLPRPAGKLLHECGQSRLHLSHGINEQVFTHRQYKRFIVEAGMDVEVFHPRWDVAAEGEGLRVEKNIGLKRADFQISEQGGSAARRLAHRLGIEALLRRSGLAAELARQFLFQFTLSYRILVGRKPTTTPR